MFLLATEVLAKLTNPSMMGKAGDVVDAYEQGLLGRFPRARYPVGIDCFAFYLPVEKFPEWLGDWLIKKLVNLPGPIVRKE